MQRFCIKVPSMNEIMTNLMHWEQLTFVLCPLSHNYSQFTFTLFSVFFYCIISILSLLSINYLSLVLFLFKHFITFLFQYCELFLAFIVNLFILCFISLLFEILLAFCSGIYCNLSSFKNLLATFRRILPV